MPGSGWPAIPWPGRWSRTWAAPRSTSPTSDRLRYHAAAVIASNHLVALLGQVERVAATVDVPLEAYLDLVRGTVDNVAALGPSRALTGPVARGDLDTVERHLAALPPEERGAYGAMVEQARRLVADRGGRATGPRVGSVVPDVRPVADR